MIRLGGVSRDAHPREYGDRQTATARAILDALVKQPGIVLADEVGMGKTYVALAVAASVLLATRGSGRPVVVMMPPGLLRKWADEWTRFIGHCVADPKSLAWVNTAEVRTATDFFKVLDNRGAERAHLIFMPTNALSRGLQDAWIRLALIRLARTRTKLSRRQRGGLFRWAAELVKLKRYEKRLTEHVIRRLLGTDLADWRQLLIRVGLLAPSDDDPVPEHLRKHAGELNWQRLAATLRHRIIPGRKGRVSKERLATARDQLREAFADLYEQWLACARWRASLLILDEAHHAKNDDTRLASLLRAEGSTELVETDERRKRPRLQDKFDRMLFLTATPFQLGHRELIRVLRSFASARWSGAQTPTGTRAEFLRALVELERRLDAYHLGARHLDRTWGRLAESLIAPAAIGSSVEETVERWWRQVASSGDDEVTHEIVRAIRECQDAKRRAELDGAAPWQSLRTWVIRHNRPSALPARRG